MSQNMLSRVMFLQNCHDLLGIDRNIAKNIISMANNKNNVSNIKSLIMNNSKYGDIRININENLKHELRFTDLVIEFHSEQSDRTSIVYMENPNQIQIPR